jgi:hypothetical protein
MDTVTRTFPIDLTSDYTPDSIIELCHFRDMAFDDDERVGVYLESFFCNLNLRSFNLGVFPDFDGDESEIEKMSLFNAAEAKSQKIGLRILFRKNNIGNWKKRAEIILVNRGRDDYFDLLQPYLAKNQVRIFEKNDALAIQLIDYNNGLLKPVDSLSIEAAFTITIAKKNSLEAFEARLALLELAIKDRINDIPPDSLLGREMGTGVVEVISQAKFATPAMIDQAIIDWVGTSPENLDTLMELAAAFGNDPNFSSTILDLLATKVSLAGNEDIGGNKNFTGFTGFGNNIGEKRMILNFTSPTGSGNTRLLFNQLPSVDKITSLTCWLKSSDTDYFPPSFYSATLLYSKWYSVYSWGFSLWLNLHPDAVAKMGNQPGKVTITYTS